MYYVYEYVYAETVRTESLDPVIQSARFLCIYSTMVKNSALTKITLVTVGVNSEGPPGSVLYHFRRRVCALANSDAPGE
jgi:hypothetical protein